MDCETVRLQTVAPCVPADALLTLFAIDNKLPTAIFLIVSGVLPSASEGFDRYVLSLSLYISSVAVVNQRHILTSARFGCANGVLKLLPRDGLYPLPVFLPTFSYFPFSNPLLSILSIISFPIIC